MTRGDKALIAVGGASAAIGLGYLVFLIIKTIKNRKVYVESFDEAIENHKTRTGEEVHEEPKVENGDENKKSKEILEEVKKETPIGEYDVTEDEANGDIEVIEYDDFETESGYEICDFSLYSDGIVADNAHNDDIVENPELLIGKEAFKVLEYSDSVYVRNNLLKAYYEITKVDDTYEVITGRKPVKKRNYKRSNGTKKKADGDATVKS